jgi:hypothetical protein
MHSRLREHRLDGGSLEKKILHIPHYGFPTSNARVTPPLCSALIAAAVGFG